MDNNRKIKNKDYYNNLIKEKTAELNQLNIDENQNIIDDKITELYELLQEIKETEILQIKDYTKEELSNKFKEAKAIK